MPSSNKVDRRSFVKSAGAAGAAVAAVLPKAQASPGILTAKAAAEPINYGFIGPGSRGGGFGGSGK